MIFAYGYGCYAFKHNICGDKLEVRNGMPDSSDPLPPEFFMNRRCPLARAPTEAIATEVEKSETVEKAMEPERSALAEDFAEIS